MEQHSMPRQITSFEFKLIGFLTLKQFIYLIISVPVAFIVLKVFPIPLLNILLAVLVVFLGVALAFIPFNDRPLDVLIRNLIRRLFAPTQFIYRKESKPLYFLEDLYFLADPHLVTTHIESREKLTAYLIKRRGQPVNNAKKQNINNLLSRQGIVLKPNVSVTNNAVNNPVSSPPVANLKPLTTGQKKPFLIGLIKNNKNAPIPSVLLYIKDQNGKVVRLLKTNTNGVFATYNLLPSSEYLFEIKDPAGHYFFDTMKIKIENSNPKPLEFKSKELL